MRGWPISCATWLPRKPRARPLYLQVFNNSRLWYLAYLCVFNIAWRFCFSCLRVPSPKTSNPWPTASPLRMRFSTSSIESDLRNFPERATAFGDYRYNDKLAERSLEAIAQFHKTDQAFLARLQAIPPPASTIAISSPTT